MNNSNTSWTKSIRGIKKNYSKNDFPIHSTGQGTRPAGTEYALISIPMMKFIEQTTTGFTTKNIDITKTWSINVTRFVNDKRIFSSIPKTLLQQIPTALWYLQQASQYLKHLLNSSGRKLEYDKCVFYVISWIFHEDITATMNTNSS